MKRWVNKEMNNRGQVALSILVALVVIALILVIVSRNVESPVSGRNIYGIETDAINISSCGVVLEASGNYVLNKSLNAGSASWCIKINATDVTLDCKGYNISIGEPGNCIGVIILKDDSTIKNCIFSNSSGTFDSAISLRANDAVITNNLIEGGSTNAITIDNSHDSVISNNWVYRSTNFAIGLSSGSSENTIVNNTLINGIYDGIRIGSSSDNTVHKNNITGNAYGIRISGTIDNSKNNLIYDNYFSNSQEIDSIVGAVNKWNTTYSCTSGSKQNILGGDCIGGNYWSNYNGLDDGNGIAYPWNRSADGYGDTQIPYNDSGRINVGGDYHPLLSGVAISSAPDTHTTAEFWTETYTLSSSQFHAGYSLKVNATQRVRVSIGGDNHYIGVILIAEDSVLVNISSAPQQANISDGHSKQFDVNNDTVKEVDVKVNEISNYTLTDYTANLTIKEITSSVANLCGDGNLSAGEQCDGTKLNSSTCASILGTGYTGTLACTASCTFNTTRCSAPATTPTIPTTPTPTPTPTTAPEEESNALLWIIIIFAVILIIALVIFFIIRKNRAGEQPAQPSPFISPRPPSFPPNRIPQLPPRPYIPQPARVPIVQQPRPIMLRQPIQPRPIMLPPGTKIPQMQPSSQQPREGQPPQGDLPPSPPR